jgi:hypothetical protein
MIPSVLAQHVEQGVKDFLRTTFPVATPLFADTIEQLLNEPGHLFKEGKTGGKPGSDPDLVRDLVRFSRSLIFYAKKRL